jgi:hypothetical protein
MRKIEKKFNTLLLGLKNKPFNEKLLTALFPVKGDKYNRELMVVGRAVNGWGTEKDKIWWKSKAGPKKVMKEIVAFSGKDKGDCPLKWVTDNWDSVCDGQYRMNKSAFWRVNKKILSKLEITDAETQNWSSYLVWTNLYKVAPAKGGNPSEKLCNAQFENCLSMLEAEIELFKPKRILFLTGYNWFKDFDKIKFKNKKTYSDKLIEWEGYFDKIKIVVAKHPERKDETKYVEQVVKSFSSL